MVASDMPKARQSQLVTTYGVGSLFPSGDQSFMICGTDEWDETWCAPVEEPRLARSLGVHVFRSPSTGRRKGDVPVIRFPIYHYCPKCRRLDPFWKFDAKRMQCGDCLRDLTPSRFVACCEDGHIEDFPYFQWVHRVAGTGSGKDHRLELESRGTSSSLADIFLRCSCGAEPRSLEGAFSRHALTKIKGCGGRRPWLPAAPDQACEKPLRALQRGSSNVWFAGMRSSISIPPWSGPDAQLVAKHWAVLEHIRPEVLEKTLEDMIASSPQTGLSVEGIIDLIRQRRGLPTTSRPSDQDLREEEYRALIDGNEGSHLDTFQCVEVDVSPAVTSLVQQVSKATRLREVRALYGFSRVTPMATDTIDPQLAKLSEGHRNWLPASEVLGEGIFVRLHEDVVASWEQSSSAIRRQQLLAESLERRASESGAPLVEAPGARFVAIHSIAHALIQELSLEAGYPVGSIRERIYAAPGQAGFLMYTASSDAAGSLGGLARLADEERFSTALLAAVSRAAWCSNDPVCSESGPSGTDGLNLAACHACLLLPETSCEHRNIFLDRVSVVGRFEGEPGEQRGGLVQL